MMVRSIIERRWSSGTAAVFSFRVLRVRPVCPVRVHTGVGTKAGDFRAIRLATFLKCVRELYGVGPSLCGVRSET